jgi:rhodanese-related sulfurtransferase
MFARPVDPELLVALSPVKALTKARRQELAILSSIERVPRGLSVSQVITAQEDASLYLLAGDILWRGDSEPETTWSSGTPRIRNYPLPSLLNGAAIALTDLDILRIDNDLLDIMLTWDQIALPAPPATPAQTAAVSSDPPQPEVEPDWMLRSGMFSGPNLKYGALSRLSPTRIQDLFASLETMPVQHGQIVIREGEDGDYYYLIEAGRALVSRMVGGTVMQLAELKAGDAFGEEALVSDSKRNATITMLTDGTLLRLAKAKFIELLQAPLLSRIQATEALQQVASGARWLDVRYPSEYQYDRLPTAINIPLNEIRNAIGVLDPSIKYITYCQSGRRSAIAAFILAQRGYQVVSLDGGLWSMPSRRDPAPWLEGAP